MALSASVLTVAQFSGWLNYVSKANSLTGVSNHAFDITCCDEENFLVVLLRGNRKIKSAQKLTCTTNMSALHTVFTHALLSTLQAQFC